VGARKKKAAWQGEGREGCVSNGEGWGESLPGTVSTSRLLYIPLQCDLYAIMTCKCTKILMCDSFGVTWCKCMISLYVHVVQVI